MKFLTRDQIRALDRIAIDDLGIRGTRLMENAGRGAADVARSLLRKTGASRVAVVAGTGNNGGDGFVVARHLARSGLRVRVLLLGEPRTPDARAMLGKIRRDSRVRVSDASGERFDRAAVAIDDADLVVDAVFGTGLDREVDGGMRAVLERVGTAAAPILSLDVPSGLDADTGRPLGAAVRATATATFGALKRGIVGTPGIEFAGTVHVIPIGIPPEIFDRVGWDGEVVEASDVRAFLPVRPVCGHKGTFGHVLVVGGSPGKTGAALLAALAALRAGAGLATIAARGAAAAALDAKVVEVMTEALPTEGAEGAKRAADLAAVRDAVVVGPGLGTDAGARKLVQAVLAGASVPVVLDADALTLVAGDVSALVARSAPTILTPHAGELARLLATTAEEIGLDRIGAARRAAERTRSIVVLKGARTVVAEPSGTVRVNPTGGPVLATGGTGDVLAGILGSLLAQGVQAPRAATLAPFLHGLAGDILTEEGIDRGILAAEVAAAVPRAIRRLRIG